MRFEAQTMRILDQYCVFLPLPAMVGVLDDRTPTGLAYHLGIHAMTHPSIKYEDSYSLPHLASGLCVSWDPSVKDEAPARCWLELVVFLTDWVCPAWVLKANASTLQEQAEVACRQACAEQEREEVKTALPGVAFPGNACL